MSNRFKIAMAVGLIALAVALFLISPFFTVGEVIISGYNRVSRDEIYAKLDMSASTNVFFFNQNSARERIKGNLYIDDVEIRISLPRYLFVDVRERNLVAYIEHMPNSFLVLDENGRVVNIRSTITEPLPIVRGLHFTRFRLGELLEVPDPTAFSAVVRYTQILTYHELIDRISFIDVSDTSNIRILIYNLEFNVGTIHNADEKIRTMVAQINSFSYANRVSANIDLRVIRSEYFWWIIE